MAQKEMPNLDMETVRLFVTLFETLNLSLTADRCSMSVPSASRILSKLRRIAGDELFTRYHLGMVPTARAREIEPILRCMWTDYQRLLTGGGQIFDPRDLSRTFRIGAVDYGVCNYLTPALGAIMAAAPSISIDFRPLGQHLTAQLKSGELDLAIYPMEHEDSDIRAQPICRDTMVFVVHRDHPLVALSEDRPLTERDIMCYRFVKTSFLPINAVSDDIYTVRQSSIPFRSSETAVWVPYFTQAFECLVGTKLVATMGAQLAARKVKEDDRFVILGKPANATVFVPNFLWHTRVDKDPAIQWLRGMFLSERINLVSPEDFPTIEP